MLALFLFSLLVGATSGVPVVSVGLDVAHQDDFSELRGKNVAILTTPSGVLSDSLIHLVDVLHFGKDRYNVSISGVLAAEHGFRGDHQAESGDPDSYVDPVTGITVHSVYRKNASSIALILNGVDVVISDFQDAGVRLYTFIWTMYTVLEGVSLIDSGRRPSVVVLDRPNPLGGEVIEGPLLNTSCCSSRYGRASIPHIHGMTVGELGKMFSSLHFPGIDLKVVPMKGWSRGMLFGDTSLPWILPSPNLPTSSMISDYASNVFLEATTVSEGRGTTLPFSLFGAPWLNAESFASSLNSLCGEDTSKQNAYRAAYFTPTWFKYNKTVCKGAQHAGSPVKKTFRRAVCTLKVLRNASSHFEWDGSWFGWGPPSFRLVDLYAGTPEFRRLIDSPATTVDAIVQKFQSDAETFASTRAPYLLY